MAHTFHKKHGKNLTLSEDRTTVSRRDRSSAQDGVAMTSRPLRVGEMFEVMLCELSARVGGKGGLEIGVTTNDPNTFHFPTFMTDCKENITIMFSGQDIVRNKSKIDLLNSSTYNLKVGGVLGVCLRNNGDVDFYLDKQCVASTATKYVGDIWGVVDLYGQASQAAIYTGQAPPSPRPTLTEVDVEKLVATMARVMKEKPQNYQEIEKMAEILIQVRRSSKSHHEKLLSSAVQLDTASIITKYLVSIRKQDNEAAGKTYVHLLALLIRLTDVSLPYCVALGKAGYIHLAQAELKLVKTNKSDEAITQTIIGNTMIVLHNCVKAKENVVIARPLRMVETVQVCIDSRKYKESFVITSVMTMSYIMEENEASLARMAPDTCQTVLDWLKKAISDDDRRYHGWRAAEICDGLANLAADFINLKHVMERSGHVLFARLLLLGVAEEKESAMRALQAHTCRQSYKLLSSLPKLLDLLRAASQEGTEKCKAMAADVLRQLESYIEKNPPDQKKQMQRSGEISHSMSQGKALHDLLAALSLGTKTCPYQQQCHAVIRNLKLPESYFMAQLDRCSCESCWNTRGDEDYHMRGEPPKKYSLAKGWCRFGLRPPAKSIALQVPKKWHKAFHGTKQRFVQKILEIGELGLPGERVLGGEQLYARSVHRGVPSANANQIFVSPSIHYAGADCYATPETCSTRGGQRFEVRVMFELFIAPGSYRVGEQTIGASGRLDPQIPNAEIEWTTSEQGSTVLYGLLIHMKQIK